MIPRSFKSRPLSSNVEANRNVQLPGLISSLRPIRRTLALIQEEAHLLRRFTYKNKNQHKGSGWWRKIIQVDRALHRLLTEVEAMLAEFGVRSDQGDPKSIEISAVVTGIVRLPRSCLIVEKFTEVALAAAGIFEQLVHSRAFLSFAVIVVALVARLYSLAVSLTEDLAKLSVVLVRLVHANSVQSDVEPIISRLPGPLRRFVPRHTPSLGFSSAFSAASQNSSIVQTPADSRAISPDEDFEDLGSVVSRDMVQQIEITPAAPISPPQEITAVGSTLSPENFASLVSTKSRAPSLPQVPASDIAKQVTRKGDAVSAPSLDVPRVKVKRKKVKRAKGDEIDAIFG